MFGIAILKKKNTRRTKFLRGKEMNTVTQYSNFTIFKLTKDIFRNTGQYTFQTF